MQRIVSLRQSLSPNLWSKLIDGILSVIILCLTWMVIAICIYPIESVFGMPGLLIYILGLLSVAMYSLQQSLVQRKSEPTRAWFGIAAGVICWAVIWISTHVGASLEFPATIIFLIMVGLIVILFWRTIFTIGPRFFSLALLLSWVGYAVMTALSLLAERSQIFMFFFQIAGYLALLCAILLTGWMILKSQRRIHQIIAALAIWFLLTVAIYVFLGLMV